ncbi:MAG: hypothetical protein HC831_28300 [Chloroflexia bacterium]|nr:hypothetical protein [Bacteroidales bacterium]NJO92436.1 hypothetical protein [Chloroflexia bacterium]
MTTLRFLTVCACLAILISVEINAQKKLSIFSSTGYTSHLSRKGINLELGLDYEVLKRLDVSVAYRYNYMNRELDNKVEINNVSLYLSWIVLNKNSHRLLIGPGVYYGKYLRFNDYMGFEKEYTDTWINPVRLQYDYTFTKNIKIGGIVSLYGDDSDGTTYFGFLLGYKF